MSKKKAKRQKSIPTLPSTDDLIAHYTDVIKTPKIDYDNPKDLKFLERIFIDHCKETQMSFEGESKELFEHLDYTKHYLRKKRQTYLSFVRTVSEKFSSKHPDVFVEERFAMLNAASLDSYDMYASIFHIDYAVALWILDELRANEKIHEAVSYLPEETDDDFILSTYHDASHDTDVIDSLLYLIRNRNGDTEYTDKFFVGQTELQLDKKRNYSIPDEDKAEDLTYRERFDAIIALIPEERIEKAVNRFKDKAWEYFDLLLNGINYYRSKELRLLRRLQRMTESISEARAKSLNTLQSSPIISKALPSQFASLNGGLDYIKQIEEAAEIEQESNKFGFHQDAVAMVGSTMKFRIDFCNEFSETEIGKSLSSFEVDNPFETCFAALYMLDSGDDFAWLYGLCIGVLQTAIYQLPWGRVANLAQLLSEKDFRKREESAKRDENGSESNDDENNPTESSDEKKTPDFIVSEPESFDTDLYKKNYSDDSIFNGFDIEEPVLFTRLNLPQIVFEETGVVMPRTSTLISRSTFYKKANSSDDIYKHYLNLIESSRMRDRETLVYSDEDSYEEDIIQDNLLASIAKENDVFKKEREEMRRKLITSHQERNALRKEIRSLQSANENLEKELKELRAMIRERDNYSANSENTESSLSPISFPYEAKHRFVVFGGHASWAKAIKPLLKNVRFVDAYAKPNVALILNADVVWLQSNAIGHSSYYKIMNLVREHHIPLQYFEAASAEKCAEQLAHFDISMGD